MVDSVMCDVQTRDLVKKEVIHMDLLIPENMTEPHRMKIERYRAYYRRKWDFAHEIIIDENNHIRNGYCSYLIAKEFGLQTVSVLRIDSSIPFEKVVSAYHVRRKNGVYAQASGKAYTWRANVRKPVIPGDILLVKTGERTCLVRVGRVGYAVGEEDCARYDEALKHIESCRLPRLRGKSARY